MTIRRHIPAIIQLLASIIFLIKSFQAPINVGQVGPDNWIIYFLILILASVISFIIYISRLTLETIIPFVIAILTIITLRTGKNIEKEIRNKNILIDARANRLHLTLFKDNTFEHTYSEAEFGHYDRGKYFKSQYSIDLDTEVELGGYGKTKKFYKSDSALYTIPNYFSGIDDRDRIDTLWYYFEH